MRPGIDAELVTRALVTVTGCLELSASLAELGPHRFALAVRAAAAAVGGGGDVSVDEEDRIAQWFAGIVDEAIRRGGLRAAVAIWLVLAGDDHACGDEGRVPRCPVVAMVPSPPSGAASEPGELATFVTKLRAAAPGYVRTAIACASDEDMLELREIVCAGDDGLEDYRPWGVDLAEDAPASGCLDNARATLTCRRLSNAEACSGVGDWAHGFAGMVAEHAIPPVFRIGAIAWLARVALRDEERAA